MKIPFDMNDIILFILGLDTFRFVIASTGIINRKTRFIGRLIYGKFDAVAIEEALDELGYSSYQAKRTVKNLRHVAKQENRYPNKDIPLKLIFILSKYILEFDKHISYGMIDSGKKLSYSRYYINTMEAVHDVNDLHDMAYILIRLMSYKEGAKKIDFVIVPKGGNPLLAQYIASELRVSLIIAKDINDSARPKEDQEQDKIYKIHYEGLDILLKNQKPVKRKFRGVVVDCNTSGGTQLINVVSDFNKIIRTCDLPIKMLSSCYVLFGLKKSDDNGKTVDIDKKFKDHNCKLYRYFDLDEEDKRDISKIECDEYYDAYFKEELQRVLNKIKSKHNYFSVHKK